MRQRQQQQNFDQAEVLEMAQADGLACVYCGRSGRKDGSLAPLRAAVRPASRSRCALTQASIGRSVPGVQVSRCEPPCQAARTAYQSGFSG